MKHRMILAIAIILASFALASATAAKAAGIAVTIDPAEISLGEAAQLTVAVQGREDVSPEIPAVDGLSFESVGQSSQIRVVSGVMSANVTHTFTVIPDRAGNFIIPAIKVRRGREVATSQPVSLKVAPSGRGAAARPSRGNSLPAPNIAETEDNVNAPDPNSFGFLRIVSPKKEFYVGEMVPVELRAYFRAGVELRVDGLPRLNSDAFAINKLGDEPARSQQMIDGVPYTVFSWPTAITAVKAGDYELSIEIPTTVTVRQQAARSGPRGGNPFGDSFFDDAFFNQFFGRATQKQVVLSSQPGEAKILSLPSEGRPAHFSGAVGVFEITAEATPTKTSVGDPVTLKLQVRGLGNFDRVSAPSVEQGDTWKSYKASATFNPTDNVGLSGEKTFEQALVPTQAGNLEIPALAFSYFDPAKKQYVTRSTTPIQIEVAPGQSARATPSQARPDARAAAAASATAPVASEAFAPKSATGRTGFSLPSWLISPSIIATFLGSTLVVFAGVYFARRQRRLSRDPKNILLAESQAAIAIQVQIMESAVARGATFNFFAAARRALQIQLGRRWNLPPQTITQAEINSRMSDDAADIRPVFEAADQVTYTGRVFTRTELRHWQNAVRLTLAKLG